MKMNLSKFERTAGLFLLTAFIGFVGFTVFVAIKQGWFSPKHHYKTSFAQGEGLHAGTAVQISGLRAGSVESVRLNDENKIEVTLSVSHDFYKKIKEDSFARVIRPFIIGDKVVEITLGSKESTIIAENASLKSEETMDLMDLMGGGHMGPYLQTLDSVLKNLQVVAEAFADPKRSKAIIGMFDQALPTMLDVRELSQQMTRHKNLAKSLEKIAEFSKHLPEMGQGGAKMIADLNKLLTEMNKVLPALVQVAPQLPEASQRSVEALREAVVVLKAMQKSFLLKGAVKDVKEEEEKERLPANAH